MQVRHPAGLVGLQPGAEQVGEQVVIAPPAALSAIYDFGKATGDILAHGTDYQFSVPVAHKPSGLYEATAVVRGATVKAGWIVLSNGTKVGSLESNADAAAPSATRAPALDVATGTARDGGTVLVATRVSGVTGSGF